MIISELTNQKAKKKYFKNQSNYENITSKLKTNVEKKMIELKKRKEKKEKLRHGCGNIWKKNLLFFYGVQKPRRR